MENGWYNTLKRLAAIEKLQREDQMKLNRKRAIEDFFYVCLMVGLIYLTFAVVTDYALYG